MAGAVLRNPVRKALFCSAIVAVGALLVWFGAHEHGRAAESGLAIASIALGIPAVAFGLIFLVQALLLARGRSKLLAGKDVLARWHVAPADWDRFRAFDAARSASEPFQLANDLWIRKTTPPQGVDVIIGKNSLIVDDSYHVLRPYGLPELRAINRLVATTGGAPECLEFRLAYPTRGGSRYTTLRIPVPSQARGESLRVYDWFEPRLRRKPALALRNTGRTYRICLVFGIGCLAAFAIGWMLVAAGGYRIEEEDFGSVAPFVLMLVGSIGVVFALLLALATYALAPGKKGA